MRWVLVLVLAAGCRTAASVSPYAPQRETERETTRAEKLSREAADLVDSAPAKAESLLREALSLDLYFGPAHNNLGVVFLKAGKLYEAAHEFEWARKLLPGNPDPRVNLAITLEKAGRIGDAIDAYRAALEVAPEHIGAIEGIACATVRANRSDDSLTHWLETIALQGEDGRWREWARSTLAWP